MARNPRTLIRESRKEIRSLMQANLFAISEKIINQIMASYKSLPDSRKINATNKVDIPAGQNYKIQLREALAVIARESIELAKEEVPSNVKFAEFEKLPPAIRRYLEARAKLYVATQIGEVAKKISFNYSDAILQTDSPDQVKGAMTAAATAYAEGPAVAGGSAKIAADSVNYARKQYFEDPEVNDQIEAFQYINTEPVSAICKDLAGHVFRKDDPDLDKYTPPFHFNCDGWLRPILIGNLRGREPKKYVPTKKAAEAIQFGESCQCGVHLAEDKLIPPKQAQANAEKGLELRRKWGRGGTNVGVARARDISNGANLSPGTVSRMASFNRHRNNYRPDKKDSDGGPTAGTIAWLLWGGNAGVDWALRKSKMLNKKEMEEVSLADTSETDSGNLQSIVVSKEKADSLNQAKEIAKDFGAKSLTVDETNTSYRFRQRNPSDFRDGSFRSKSIPEKGVTLIYGQLA